MDNLAWPILGSFAAIALYWALDLVIRPYFSPLCALPGPSSPSWLWGLTKKMSEFGDEQLIEEWLGEYGNSVMVKGVLNARILLDIDVAG